MKLLHIPTGTILKFCPKAGKSSFTFEFEESSYTSMGASPKKFIAYLCESKTSAPSFKIRNKLSVPYQYLKEEFEWIE